MNFYGNHPNPQPEVSWTQGYLLGQLVGEDSSP